MSSKGRRVINLGETEMCLGFRRYQNLPQVCIGGIEDQVWVKLILIRVYCTGPDRHTHVLLPSFLLPHKHHLLATYKQVIDKIEPYVFVSLSTKKRMRG